MSKGEEAIKNFEVGILSEVVFFFVGLYSRAVFVRTLGETYLGVGNLYSSIITILTLTNLGLGDAIVYLFLRAFADHDQEKIRVLYYYSKKIFFILCLIILAASILLLPLVSFTVNGALPVKEMYLYYAMFVANTITSYFAAPYNMVFRADQKIRVITWGQILSYLFITILQINELKSGGGYFGYLCFMILANVLNWVYIRFRFRRYYSYLESEKSAGKITSEDKKLAIDYVKNMFVIKVTGGCSDSIDNFTISRFVGIGMLGLYSNYLVIIGGLRQTSKQLYNALFSGIGQVNVLGKLDKIKVLYEQTEFVFHCMATIIITGIFVLAQDFIILWIGNGKTLEMSVVGVICMDLYFNIFMYSQSTVVNTTYILGKLKKAYLIMDVLNLVLSIILGYYFGLVGIILATLFCRLSCNLIVTTYYIYNDFLEDSVWSGIKKIVGYVCQVSCIVMITYAVIHNINGGSWLVLLIKGVLTVIFVIVLLLLFNIRNDNLHYLWKVIQNHIFYLWKEEKE